MPSALENVKVVELCRVLAGPWAGQTLADLGADVIKVEHPERGDDTRGWGPPYFMSRDDNCRSESAYFLSANRNKRSVAINFAHEEGSQLVIELARRADILIENFRPGALGKYGLDYASLSAINPRLIYCSITAFGQDGPASHRPGYDLAIQAIGGLMSLTGQPDGAAGAGPVKTGVAISDLFSGLYSTIGILAALQARHASDRGQHLDIGLFDTQVAMLANQGMNYLVSGEAPVRLGNGHPNVVPYQSFQTADGYLVLAVGSDEQFQRCCRQLGREDLAGDERYRQNRGRVDNRDSLLRSLSETFLTRSTSEWLALMEQADVPAAPINRLDQVFAEPQSIARALRIELPHPFGQVPSIASPIRLSETPPTYRRAPPLLGEHTDEVLMGELGLDVSRVETLRAAGVVM
jgi:crotonobetainyl-CoA:carnitine CoA-transferase CaiB-like acyl-CoA transferase